MKDFYDVGSLNARDLISKSGQQPHAEDWVRLKRKDILQREFTFPLFRLFCNLEYLNISSIFMDQVFLRPFCRA